MSYDKFIYKRDVKNCRQAIRDEIRQAVANIRHQQRLMKVAKLKYELAKAERATVRRIDIPVISVPSSSQVIPVNTGGGK